MAHGMSGDFVSHPCTSEGYYMHPCTRGPRPGHHLPTALLPLLGAEPSHFTMHIDAWERDGTGMGRHTLRESGVFVSAVTSELL